MSMRVAGLRPYYNKISIFTVKSVMLDNWMGIVTIAFSFYFGCLLLYMLFRHAKNVKTP